MFGRLKQFRHIAIGTTRLPVRTFLLINAVAATVWGAAFVSAGYFFGSAIEVVFGRIRSVAHIMLPLVTVAIAIGFTGLLIRCRKSADKDATGA